MIRRKRTKACARPITAKSEPVDEFGLVARKRARTVPMMKTRNRVPISSAM
jgi:hypothetical protein